ncbi:uncharacterized protein MKZ38_003609 [Zalerion maritima]|uniref:Amino-acid acetyltransferase, mitochondrial n=1 Tax=Zalerion maritima TaxID=339359 RepID=A0AAD5RNK6_9PEZI|nr:uncharacterized protein MKZ38_003609 [Zalerion maritima]
MILRKTAWNKASSVANNTFGLKLNGSKRTLVGGTTHERPGSPKEDPANHAADLRARLVTIPEAQKARRSLDRDFFMSVLEASVTKRDAKTYLKTFTPSRKGKDGAPAENDRLASSAVIPCPGTIRSIEETPRFVQYPQWRQEPLSEENPPHVSLVKLRDPHAVNDETLRGVAKTLSQLRTLGMLSVIVVECDATGPEWKPTMLQQAIRVANIIDDFGAPGSRVVESAIAVSPQPQTDRTKSPFLSHNVFVENPELVMAPMRLGELPIIPSIAYTTDTHAARAISSNNILLALTRSFSGLQFSGEAKGCIDTSVEATRQPKTGIVDRVIVLDPLGGIPASHRPNGVHVFVNLEQEFDSIKRDLELESDQIGATNAEYKMYCRHIENLELAKSSLAMLPPTASAVITTLADAANLSQQHDVDLTITGIVGTRKKQNPLIHNLLTDKPVYSSSLPLGRIKGGKTVPNSQLPRPPLTTFAKRGVPLTIFPGPAKSPWLPPAPGSPKIRLTDNYIDLPRLVHLIDDSFNRKLDTEHYLARVNEIMAGVIVAGGYEGGAILTWEVPAGLTYKEAYESGRLVPYLDKFAVLKRSQGSGGVADIVFSAMVRECFPEGVCWRSRKDNPVNKWYSERSKGTYKIPGMNWTMFWTTPGLALDERRFWDYESVCRSIEPSWADKKAVPD